MDTIYAEGQRRYVESLSSYARQFLGQVQKPRVESITGLSPAIAIEQKTTSKSPRSTVGTITEVYDYLRILFTRLGQRFCPHCQIPIGTQTKDEIVEKILSLAEGTKLYILAPLERKGQEKFETIWEEIRRSGFVRMRVDGKSYGVEEPPEIDNKRKHKIEVVVDRNVVRPGTRTRIADAVEQALSLGQGVMHLAYVDLDRDETLWKVERFSQHLACDQCGRSYEQLTPNNYSFNSPLGWCPTCEGLGVQRGASVALLIGNPKLSVRQGAIVAWPRPDAGSPWLPFAAGIAAHVGFDLDTPYQDLDPVHQRAILQGTGETWLRAESGAKNSESKNKTKSKSKKSNDSDIPNAALRTPHFQYKGLFPAIDEASRVSYQYRARLDHVVDEVPCVACHGGRLRADAAATRYLNQTIREVCAHPIGILLRQFEAVTLADAEQKVIGEVLREIINRVKFLVDVGLEYLSLDRPGPTLSGGEAQRIRLASQIGSGLTGVLYVLDEPTIGLHPRDNARLLKALHHLRDLGNTLLLVEHDREVIASADYLFDFGPGAGRHGGEITAEGIPSAVLKSKASLTGQYLSGQLAIAVPTNRRIQHPEPKKPILYADASAVGLRSAFQFPHKSFLSVLGARHHNLRNIDVHLPLGAFVVVTGVSGSGKSSLVNEVLFNTLSRRLNRARTTGVAHDDITGIENIDKIIRVDQDPLGNSPSSNPATYTGVFDLIRELFSRMPESKVRGYPPRRFSFNQKGGRCEACEGNGQKKIEMHFLPDVWVECDTCHGTRYNLETLAVHYRGKSISDVLNLPVDDALELFGNIPKVRVILQTLSDVGLGYMQLGQPAPTMSGGEAQRVKLAAELARPSTGKTLYLLDEPTTGLHFDDVKKLLNVLHRLTDLGNTVIVVEHNLDVIKTADWIVDMGPEAGSGGGEVVSCGTPESVVQFADIHPELPLYTSRALKPVLVAGPFAERERYDAKKALAKKLGDLSLDDVGKDQKLPWEANGIQWHTRDRITTKGTPCKWDGAALLEAITGIEQLGDFGDTVWEHRSIVEIPAAKKSLGWFLHAMTGHEAYLKLVFRVARNTFKQAAVVEKLALRPLSDYPGHEGYARDHRVEVSNPRGPWQEVVVTIVKVAEVQAKSFQQFLKQAADSFLAATAKTDGASAVDAAMPWKINGEQWHVGDKGFPPGKKPKWDRALLPKFLQLLHDVEPTAELKHDVRDAITVRLPEISRFWVRIKTKEVASLEVWLVAKPGAFNAARFEGVGALATVEADRQEGCAVVKLHFVMAEQLASKKLLPLLRELQQGFIGLFGES